MEARKGRRLGVGNGSGDTAPGHYGRLFAQWNLLWHIPGDSNKYLIGRLVQFLVPRRSRKTPTGSWGARPRGRYSVHAYSVSARLAGCLSGCPTIQRTSAETAMTSGAVGPAFLLVPSTVTCQIAKRTEGAEGGACSDHMTRRTGGKSPAATLQVRLQSNRGLPATHFPR